jgi:hypothetical protein
VVDDFNTWWVVVYGRVMGALKADGDRKRKYCDWSDTKVLAVPIVDFMSQDELQCNFGPT